VTKTLTKKMETAGAAAEARARVEASLLAKQRRATDAEKFSDKAHAVVSLGRSRAMIESTRGVPCQTHDARRFAPCWGDEKSGVRGYCTSRIARGMQDANRGARSVR
jgi:hypothetical protein